MIHAFDFKFHLKDTIISNSVIVKCVKYTGIHVLQIAFFFISRRVHIIYIILRMISLE